jgi:hypothetical protein
MRSKCSVSSSMMMKKESSPLLCPASLTHQHHCSADVTGYESTSTRASANASASASASASNSNSNSNSNNNDHHDVEDPQELLLEPLKNDRKNKSVTKTASTDRQYGSFVGCGSCDNCLANESEWWWCLFGFLR